MSTPDSSTSDQLDYAIVGGGVSGLYTAWRLQGDAVERGEPLPRIAVYELSDRTGGRLLTWLPAGPDAGLRAELGGMRFMPQQELVWNLLPELGFEASQIVEFPVKGDNLRLLLRGVSTRLDTPHPTERYKLPPGEVDQQPAQLVQDAIAQVLTSPDNQAVLDRCNGGRLPGTRQEWDAVKPGLTWNGRRLWDLGMWNVLSDVRTPETYAYITDAFGYFSLNGNWNAAEAMQFLYLDFVGAPDYRTLTAGYSALPDKLRESVEQHRGHVRTGVRLVGFDAAPGGGATLRLDDGGGGGGAETVEARNLILAMPRRSLELLAPSPSFDLQGSPELRSLVQSVTPYPAFKLFLFYEERWWEKQLGITVGRSVSDLPIRQTYYMPPDPRTDDVPIPPYGLLMASYDDARAVDYWQGLVPREDEREQGRAELHEAVTQLVQSAGTGNELVPAPPPNLHKATDDMLRHAKDQIALLHDLSVADIPDPVVGGFADWGLDPFGGGWNFWMPQVDVRDVMTRIKQPLGQGTSVFVVGDGYSGAAGWVEGALTATEKVLQDHLGLAPPKWLPEGYYLGW